MTIFTCSLDVKTERDPNHRHGLNEGRQNDEAVKKEDAREDLGGGRGGRALLLNDSFVERQK